eukprot:jgi/Mesvir1/12352/Mv00535-RA.1
MSAPSPKPIRLPSKFADEEGANRRQTFSPTVGNVQRDSRKKVITPDEKYHHWDFLQGRGPSAPKPSDGEFVAKEPGAFKPHWTSKKPLSVIDPAQPRREFEKKVEERQQKLSPKRAQYLLERDRYNGFDPIKCVDVSPRLAPETVRCKAFVPPPPPTAHEVRAQETGHLRATLRQQLLANDGRPAQRDTMRDILKPTNAPVAVQPMGRRTFAPEHDTRSLII